MAKRRTQGTGNAHSIGRLIARELRSGNKMKVEPPYPQWREAFVAECRQWLSANGLNTKPAEYLANFIETNVERWSYTRVQATITSEEVLAKKSKPLRPLADETTERK